jgi:hypothetical protein
MGGHRRDMAKRSFLKLLGFPFVTLPPFSLPLSEGVEVREDTRQEGRGERKKRQGKVV